VKFLADENIHGVIVRALRGDGHDVGWAAEGGLAEFAPEAAPVGVILLRHRVINVPRILRDLKHALASLTAELLEGGFVLILEEGRMQVGPK